MLYIRIIYRSYIGRVYACCVVRSTWYMIPGSAAVVTTRTDNRQQQLVERTGYAMIDKAAVPLTINRNDYTRHKGEQLRVCSFS